MPIKILCGKQIKILSDVSGILPDAAAEKAHFVQRRIVGDLGAGNLTHHGVLCVYKHVCMCVIFKKTLDEENG